MIHFPLLSKVAISLFLFPFLHAKEETTIPENGLVITRPEQALGPLDNPLKGYCLYTNAGEIHRPYSMVFQYVSWKELEPTENNYAFEAWEKKTWSHPLAKGKHVVIRVYADYPKKPSGLPDWLRTKGVSEKKYSDHGGGRSPDYDHPQMLVAMERFIANFGKRYNAHPRVAFIQLGLLGFWGEWHTYPHEKWFASEETQHRIIRAYLRAFPDKQLMARYADGVLADYKAIGFHDDMFPEDTDNGKEWSFLARMRRAGHTETWKRKVAGGEMVPHAAKNWLGKQWGQTREMTRRSHFSWVGPYGPALESKTSKAFVERSDEMVRKMGYQFRLEEIRHSARVLAGAPCKIFLKGVNEGVAPFYYPWPVQLAWIDAGGKILSKTNLNDDVRKWLPGHFSINADMPAPSKAGDYRIGFGIEDPWQGKPTVRLANRLPISGDWTVLGQVEVRNRSQ